MKKNIYLFIICALALVTTKSYSQNMSPCGTTERLNEYIKTHPEYYKQQEEQEKQIQQYIEDTKYQKTTSLQKYIIPVVFHIIHEYGSENIPDATVFDEISTLNKNYNKLNPDTSFVIPEFKSIIANVGIEFRLAQIDPNGNCTNGIDRIYSYRTNNANENSKYNQWDRRKYLNIWVINTMDADHVSAAAYALFPTTTTGSEYKYDGILCVRNYVGGGQWTLTHEIGHYLGLYHPWGPTNNPGVACGDDFVTDTPETKGTDPTEGCPLNKSICNPGVIENIQNYMDYSYCNRMFTEGQKTRMLATLNSNVAYRDNLWSDANLIATGTYSSVPTQTCNPIADFYAVNDRHFICQGSNVVFKDASWNANVTGRSWTFDGGTPTTSTALNPSVTYNAPYWHSVSLTTSNSSGPSYTNTKENYVYVSPPWVDYIGAFSENFEDATKVNNEWLVVNKNNDIPKWHVTASGSYAGAKALMLNAYSPPVYAPNTFPAALTDPGIGIGDIDAIITPAIDLSHTSTDSIHFQYSYATSSGFSGDVTEGFKVYYSLNCGQTWVLINSIQGTSLVTAGYSFASFIPTMSSQWKQKSIALPATTTWSNARFKFEYTSGVYSNNLYIDNLNISGTLGINEIQMNNVDLSVYPNPTVDNATLSYHLTAKQNITIEIYDIVGKKVMEVIANEIQNEGDHTVNIHKQNLTNGIYNVRLISDKRVLATQKLVISE